MIRRLLSFAADLRDARQLAASLGRAIEDARALARRAERKD